MQLIKLRFKKKFFTLSFCVFPQVAVKESKLPVDDVALRKSQAQVKDLSDQLLRQQSTLDSSRADVLALKGRLQAALQRVDTAEQEAQRNQAAVLDVEHGSNGSSASSWATMGRGARRRKRGGRTMRSALGIRASASPLTVQLVQTIDAVDLWLLETSLILKQEPLARLGLLVYSVILHLWCFGLVVFHTVQAEHGDLDALRAHRVVPGAHSLFNPTP